MIIALSVLGVGFAASCVWLAVRIVNRRPKLGNSFWGCTAFAVLVFYVLSVGPAVFISLKMMRAGYSQMARQVMPVVYAPLDWIKWEGPEWLGSRIGSYQQWWIRQALRKPERELPELPAGGIWEPE